MFVGYDALAIIADVGLNELAEDAAVSAYDRLEANLSPALAHDNLLLFLGERTRSLPRTLPPT